MKNHSLQRLLRLRSLLEEVSRVELEARLQELRRMESTHVSVQKEAASLGRRRFAKIAEGRRSDDWCEMQVLDAWLAKEKETLEAVLYQKAREAEKMKSEYLERRKERGQVESVIETRVHKASLERSRNDQRLLDEWFGRRIQSRED
jgi:flagellar export protein FliJ